MCYQVRREDLDLKSSEYNDFQAFIDSVTSHQKKTSKKTLNESEIGRVINECKFVESQLKVIIVRKLTSES